jgi:hypothetical protein
MWVDNRIAGATNNEATSRSHTPAEVGPNRVRGDYQPNPNRSRASGGGPSQGGTSGDDIGGSSSHGADRTSGFGGDRRGRGHANSHTDDYVRGSFDTRHRIDEISNVKKTTNISDNNSFPACSKRLRALLLPRSSSLSGSPSTTRSKIQFSGSGATCWTFRTLVETTTPSVSTSPSIWTRLHSHGLSRSTKSSIDEWD